MAWTCLFIAGLLEVAWAFTMKQSEGFTRPIATIITIILMLASFGLLSFSMKTLPLGTSYTIWTGIGAVGSFIVGAIVLDEVVSAARIASAALIVLGLVGLKLTSH